MRQCCSRESPLRRAVPVSAGDVVAIVAVCGASTGGPPSSDGFVALLVVTTTGAVVVLVLLLLLLVAVAAAAAAALTDADGCVADLGSGSTIVADGSLALMLRMAETRTSSRTMITRKTRTTMCLCCTEPRV